MKNSLNGPVIVLWMTLASAAILAFLLDAGSSEEALRNAVRVTARVSFLCFFPVMIARPLHVLWRSDLSQWLMRNRRYVGLGFGMAHLVHLTAILTLLMIAFGGDIAGLGGVRGIAPGAVLYVFLILMMLTSTNASVRWLGTKRWKLLHRIGLWVLTIGFIKGFFLAKGSPSLNYGIFQGLLLLGLALRFAAWKKSS
jgi:DMSO/TMAO reductase YedYZ heme-binding membrane subunit